MAKKTRRRAPTPIQQTSDAAGLLLVASAIGHIAQASHSGELQRRQGQLEAVLKDWQAGYQRLDHQFALLRDAYQSVASRLGQAEMERREWHRKYLALQKAEGKSRKGEQVQHS